MPVITIPLNSGCHEETDQRLMTDGRLRTLRNGRVDREGRVRVRNGYTAVDERIVNVSGDEMVAYDLATYRGRMVALGDSNNDAVGYPTSLYDWIDGARPWRRVMPSGQNMPRLTHMREVIGSTGSISIDSHAAAACKDRLLFSYGPSGDDAVVMVQPSTGRVLFIDDADEGSGRVAINLKMCETDAKIIAVGQNASSPSPRFLYGYSLDETSRFMADGDIATALIDAGGGNTIADWSLARVAGAEQFVIVAELSTGAVVTRLFTAAGVNVVPSGGQFADITANPTDVAIEADTASNTVNVAMTVAGQVRLFTFNLTTGAEVGTGPHVSANMGAATAASTGLYLVRVSATSVIVVANITDAVADKVGLESYNPATNAFATSTTTYLEDAVLHAQPAYHDGETVVAIRHDGTSGTGPVLMLSVALSAAANDITPLASVDLDLWGSARGRIFEDTVTGKWYLNRLYSIGTVNDRDRAVVSEFDLDSPARRQMVEAGSLLYISGGLPLVYDGVACVEMNFADHPRIIDAVASNGAGTLDSDCTYTYGYHYQDTDARGNVIFSSVADPEEVAMGASDDTVTLTLSRAYSLRSNLGSDSWLGSFYGLVFRNTSDVVDTVATPSALLQWIRNTFTADSGDPQGDPGTETDGTGDATVESQTVIYIQAQTILDNRPPRPCWLMAFDGQRMMTNTTRAEHWRASKPLQTEEQIAFPREGILAFQGSLSSDIEAIIPYSQSWLIVTQRDLWSLNGQGPNIDGAGEFQPAYRIPSDGGMRPGGWVSVVEFGKGVMFQLIDDQLYLWTGGSPKAVGLEVQDTMLEFPNVVAACHVSRQQAVALALVNDAGDDGCIVIWDQQAGHWYRDDVGVVTAMCEHDGKLAFIKAGVVYLEDDDYGEGVAVPLTISTGNVAKTGAAGASGIQLVHLNGVFQDECTLDMRIKYTDESTFTSLGIRTLNVAAGYGVGRPFDVEWQPPRDDGSRYELELVMTSSATDTKLAWLNAIEVHYDIDDGPTRVGDARRR